MTPAAPPRAPRPSTPILLVLGGILSVQFGSALAQTLVTVIGAGGAVVLRLAFATAILLAVVRPRWRGHSRQAWLTVIAFGLALGLMNWAFYGSLAYLPIGVAVTIEFLGPLTLAAVLSRRLVDFLAVGGAAVGVVLISHALKTPWSQLPWAGLGLALVAGACWAAYVVLSGRTGQAFEKLDGLALAMVVATIVTLPAGIMTVPQWSGEILIKGVGIAILSSVLPYSLELLALRHLSAKVFGILLSLEPAVAALAGFLILGQVLDSSQLLGMALVVGASALVLGLGKQDQPPPEELEVVAESGG